LSNIISGQQKKPEFIPELNGHIISGSIQTDEKGIYADSIISFSIIGEKAKCQFIKTDDSGKFYFVSNEYGLNEIVIQPYYKIKDDYYIELDIPYSSKVNNNRPFFFEIDTQYYNQIKDAIINMQIGSFYSKAKRENLINIESNSSVNFYGQAQISTIMSDYIQLNSVAEIIKEIIPEVFIRKANKLSEFKMINNISQKPFAKGPFILVDGIPVFDINKTLAIPSKDIERIEITPLNYVYHGIVLEGILHFITKNKNLDSYKFDSNIFRQAYSFYQPNNKFDTPDYNSNINKINKIPDFRNTLYWNPELNLDENGKLNVEFFTSDEKTDYTITIEILKSDGKVAHYQTQFTVE